MLYILHRLSDIYAICLNTIIFLSLFSLSVSVYIAAATLYLYISSIPIDEFTVIHEFAHDLRVVSTAATESNTVTNTTTAAT